MRNAEIARLLGLALNTVRNYLAEIFRKAHVTTRAELAFAVAGHQRGTHRAARDFSRLLRDLSGPTQRSAQ
jgi:hypothetical protein